MQTTQNSTNSAAMRALPPSAAVSMRALLIMSSEDHGHALIDLFSTLSSTVDPSQEASC